MAVRQSTNCAAAVMQLVCMTLASMLRESEMQRERRWTGSDGGKSWSETAAAVSVLSKAMHSAQDCVVWTCSCCHALAF